MEKTADCCVCENAIFEITAYAGNAEFQEHAHTSSKTENCFYCMKSFVSFGRLQSVGVHIQHSSLMDNHDKHREFRRFNKKMLSHGFGTQS